jgi:YVTN family beta-propeller protein
MRCANFIGRVGPLAFALGVGIAVATSPATAFAEPAGSGSITDTNTSSSTTSPADTASPAGSTPDPNAGVSPSTDPSAPNATTSSGASTPTSPSVGEMNVDSSGGALTSERSGSTSGGSDPAKPAEPEGVESETPSTDPSAEPALEQPDPETIQGGSHRTKKQTDKVLRKLVAEPRSERSEPNPEPSNYSAEDTGTITTRAMLTNVPSTVTVMPAAETRSVEPTATQPAFSGVLTPLNLVARVMDWGLSQLLGTTAPLGPVESPLAWALLAWTRRQLGDFLSGDRLDTPTDPVQTSLTFSATEMAMAAAVNTAPTANPTMGTPNQTTGAIAGTINGTDADGNPLSYTVTTQPTGGTVALNSSTGAFTYTPSVAARLRAGTTTSVDFDSFAVSVSDGQAATRATVTVPVLPAVFANRTAGVTGTAPYGVAVVGNIAYVANQGTNTVTVLDTSSGGAPTLVRTITVGSGPAGLVASPDGSKVYVANQNSGTVSVIRTSDNSVVDINPATTTVDSIKVGSQPQFLAVNTAGSRLYVTNFGSNTVSVIDTATYKLIDTNPATTTVDSIQVGSNPRGIAYVQTATGGRVYVVNRSSGTVSVINADTNKLIDTNTATTTVDAIKVGSTPQQIAISPDKKFAYVTNYGSTSVSVINLATNKVDATIAVASTPMGVAVSPDSSTVYVANGNDRISVIDTKTRTVVSTWQIDAAPETNFHSLAVRGDGALLVTDFVEKSLRVVAYQRGNTAPVAGVPTAGSPDATTGAVSGLLNFKDYDGDSLTYTVTSAPASGSLSVTQGGAYTYTPTPTARQQAGQTQGPDFATFTVRASDGQATATVTSTAYISPLIQSTPYLPFDMPAGPTDKLVFAHYLPWLPVSVDNLAASQDYYTTQYLTTNGENGIHAAYGGYTRDRPMPRDPINDPDWRYLDILTEVEQAKSVGIDGFAVDIITPATNSDTINNLLRAAQTSGNFSIQLTADMSGPLGTYTSDQFASEFAPLLGSAGAQRLSDGRVVLGAFYADRQTPSWWGDTLTAFHDDYQLDVAFVPTFLYSADLESYAPISYGFSNWGGRNPADTDPNATWTGSPTDLADRAEALGKIWMQSIAFQDNRPSGGVYEESGNSITNSNGWTAAINNDAEWVQLLTWNDWAETTAMAPSAEHGWRMLDMQAYYIAQFKYDVNPLVLRDAIYVSHRDQFANSQSTYVETLPMQLRAGKPPATDLVEVVVFTTAPATVRVDIGGVVSTCQVGSGRSTCSFPLRTGTVTVSLVRNGSTVATVQSPYTVTNTPYVQDLQYHIAGGLR